MGSHRASSDVAERAGNLLGCHIYRRPTSEDSAGGSPQAARRLERPNWGAERKAATGQN